MPYLGKQPSRTAFDASDIPDDSITAAKIVDGAITIADIADDAVTADKLANSINTAIAANTAKATNATHTGEVTGSGALTIANDAVTGAKIADDAIDSEHYAAGSIDTAHIANDAITAALMADNSIDSDMYVDASIDNAHLADDAVGVAELSATGTASSSTFLRGDNSWQTAGVSTLAALTDATVSSSDPVITSNPSAVGHYWVNSSSGETFVCTDATNNLNKWMTNGDGTLIEPFDPWYGARGIIAYGMTDSSGAINNIDYITIATTGNSTDFGDMTGTKRNGGTTSNSTRGVMAGGAGGDGSTTTEIDYITVASTGNASDFGDLHTAEQSIGAATDATTAIFTVNGNMQKLTIATTGSAVNMTETVPESRNMVSGANNAARGIVSAGGYQTYAEIYYVTWASLGNALLFGNISGRYATGSFESKTRACFGGGHTSGRSNVIDYITVATTGNASDFGDIHTGAEGPGGLTSGTRGLFFAGQEPSRVNRLQYVTIDTLSNTTDFGDLTSARSHSKGLSGD